jgi:NitT/TauT family transport system ATP-binding protein
LWARAARQVHPAPLIAGLAAPTSGTVLLDGHPVTGAGPDRGLIFQQGAVYPFRRSSATSRSA